MEPSKNLARRLYSACLNLPRAQRKNLEQRHGFLRLLVAFDVLYDSLGFSILRDDPRFPAFAQPPDDFGGVSLEEADGPDLG